MVRFGWEKDYPVDEFIECQLSTSHYQLMDPGLRTRVVASLGSLLTDRFDGHVTLDWSTQSYEAIRRA